MFGDEAEADHDANDDEHDDNADDHHDNTDNDNDYADDDNYNANDDDNYSACPTGQRRHHAERLRRARDDRTNIGRAL